MTMDYSDGPSVQVSRPALVIFDCDGVLVDSEPLANQVLARTLSDLGAPHSLQDCYRAYRGLSMSSVVEKIEVDHCITLPDDFVDQLQQETMATFRHKLAPVCGVEALLSYLARQKIPICVASSGSPEKLALTLGLTNLAHYFSNNIFSATEVSRGKPAPDLFLHSAIQMGAESSETIVIEDALPGIQAALAAGMMGLGYCPRDAYGDQLLPAVEALGCQTFRSMSQCQALLTHMFD